MVQRVIGADTFPLLYDAALRMVAVQKNGATIAEFAYDGDGSRSTPAAERRERMVIASVGSVTTYCIGGYFELKITTSGSKLGSNSPYDCWKRSVRTIDEEKVK